MKRKEMTIICLLLSLWALLIKEGLFYLNFTPVSFHTIGEKLGISSWASIGVFFIILFIIMMLISLVMSHIKYQNHAIRYHLIICLVIFVIANFALSFIPDIFKEMNFLSEIALFTWVIFVFYTLLYSIFYLNLLE